VTATADVSTGGQADQELLRRGDPWMKPNGRRPPGGVRHPAVWFGLCRAVAAAPAMVGSLLLLMLGSVAVDRWAGLIPLAWAAGGAVLMTRVGERMVVRAACGFRRPCPVQAVALKPAWSTALRLSGTAAGDVELYVQSARASNAYAAGGRSVAVSSRVVEDYATGRLPEKQLVAVLLHELGHHASGATRPMVLVSWLTAPWRLARSLLTGLVSILAGPQPRRGALVAVVAGLGVAVIRTLHQGQWLVGEVLILVGLASVLCPIADAAISRRSEFAADRFAADHGLAIELAAALRALNDGHRAPCGWSRLLSSHPTSEQRIRALQTATVELGPDGGRDTYDAVDSAERGPAEPGSRCQTLRRQS
jgi:STE24 endopeptidase